MVIESGYFGPRRSWSERAIAAARLDVSAFEEVEADTTATGQAAGVVVLSAIAQAIGAVSHGAAGVIGSLVWVMCAWLVWSVVTYFVGVTLFKGTATVGELLRTLGFAQAPGVLYVLGFIPVIGRIAGFLIAIWILVAGIIAIRQALDITTGKAVITAVVGWLVVIIPLAVFGAAGWMAFR
jgi:hypothetical protein